MFIGFRRLAKYRGLGVWNRVVLYLNVPYGNPQEN